MFPQPSASTTVSVIDAFHDLIKRRRFYPHLKWIAGYADHPAYIQACQDQIKQHWQERKKGQHLLIAFHGLPEKNLKQGDPYYCFCHKTSRLIQAGLSLDDAKVSMVFQSKFGFAQWLKPSVEERLKTLVEQGIKHVDIISPGFSADCLETLEEINMRYRAYFQSLGGESLHLIPCLNDSPASIRLFQALIDDDHGDI